MVVWLQLKYIIYLKFSKKLGFKYFHHKFDNREAKVTI